MHASGGCKHDGDGVRGSVLVITPAVQEIMWMCGATHEDSAGHTEVVEATSSMGSKPHKMCPTIYLQLIWKASKHRDAFCLAAIDAEFFKHRMSRSDSQVYIVTLSRQHCGGVVASYGTPRSTPAAHECTIVKHATHINCKQT